MNLKMNNIAVIFAGGSGERMNTRSRPKQFLEFRGKLIIIYTLELFDNHPQIDGIVIACLRDWIPYLQKMLRKFEITKVVDVVEGGETGQDSIRAGLEVLAGRYPDETTVLIHDGVHLHSGYGDLYRFTQGRRAGYSGTCRFVDCPCAAKFPIGRYIVRPPTCGADRAPRFYRQLFDDEPLRV